jgi:hypothetical protein
VDARRVKKVKVSKKSNAVAETENAD